MSCSKYKLSALALLCCSTILAPAVASAQQRPSRASTSGHPEDEGATTRSTVLDTSGSREERVDVRGHVAADGTTNTVPGAGLMKKQSAPRSQTTVTRDYLAKQAQIGNVTSYIQNAAGVTVASQDPAGLISDNISMRGMNQTQIGYLFEGAPVANPITYQPYSSMTVDAENIRSITVSQSSPDLDAPLFNAVGGEIRVNMLNPASKAGGFVNFTGGSYGTNKEFVRLETGEIGHSGIRGFVSFSHLSGDNWRGPGGFRRYHVDAKFLKAWGDGNSISAIFGYNASQSTAYTEPSLAAWRQSGIHDNYSASYYPGNTSYYRLNYYALNGQNVILPSVFKLADGWDLHVTPYYIHQFGPGGYGESVPANNGYIGTQSYSTLGLGNGVNGEIPTQAVDPWNDKVGALNTSIDWSRAWNTFTAGYWYSYSFHEEANTFSPLNTYGVAPNAYGQYAITIPATGQQLTAYNLNFKQQVNVAYIADSMSFFHNKLDISGGFKVAMVSRTGTNNIPGADPYKNQKDYFEPLPQVSLSYRLTPQDQIFVNGTTAFRAPQSVEAYTQIFDPSSPHATVQPGVLRPEYSIGEELGYRHYGTFDLTLSLFNINMVDHQVTSHFYLPGTNLLITEPVDVGGQTNRGASVELGLGHWHHFSPYVTAQYLDAFLGNNFQVGDSLLPTAGKTAVGTSKATASGVLQYDDGHLFGSFDVRYVGRQYGTLMNDQSIPAYVVSDLSVGYRLPDLGHVHQPKIQLNLVNLGDNHYLSTVDGITSNAHPVHAIFGPTVTGSAPNYLVGAGFGAYATVSAGF